MLLLRALTTLVVVGVVWASTCQTFGQVKSWTQNSREYRCGQNCMASSSRVSGTEYYDQGSPVCVAALHSGAINTNGGVFTITRSYSSATPRLYGSARNRILSNSMTSQGLFVYKIEKTQATVTEADLSEDVVVVHNSYTQDRNSCPYDPVKSRACCTVLVACLSQGSTSPRLVGWDFAERSYINTAVISSSRHRVVVASSGANLHAVACLGRSPATDVSLCHTVSWCKIPVQFPHCEVQ
ncbi:uncharacterized protein LOC121880006 [Homarus americanus]|uniref:uncharacterized protein LOC121880006 n=1 Tax=Homarus americanus TaxID=6706 RepID=UPI001C443703|nr:uncharacterized protein LOC121880006 [Homarus americanus]XP_042242878.1 uncharacterized protein LOC121880006 [Homarus americanus]